ncbi:MAG: hypothetical protein P8127_13855 [Acidobacteriota bacterium]|jgi:hypothetical protein
MNGIVPGPLWLVIASATNGSSVENRTLTHHSKNGTVTGNKNDSDRESIKRLPVTGTDGSASTECEATRR